MPTSSYRSRVALVGSLVVAATLLVLAAVHEPPRPYAPLPSGAAPTYRPLPRTIGPAAPTGKTGRPKLPDLAGHAWLDIVVVVAVTLLVLVSLAGALTFLVLALRRLQRVRLGAGWALPWAARTAPPTERDETDHVVAAVTAGLAELAVGEPDDAIIACWVRLSEAAREAGIESRRSDTARDLVARVAATGRVSVDAAGRLAALYREARFSKHTMTEDDRAAARAALEILRAELQGGDARV